MVTLYEKPQNKKLSLKTQLIDYLEPKIINNIYVKYVKSVTKTKHRIKIEYGKYIHIYIYIYLHFILDKNQMNVFIIKYLTKFEN